MIDQSSSLRRAVQSRLFGKLSLELSELIHFPDGLPGFPACRTFALLKTGVSSLAWLQSADQPDVALLLVSPGNGSSSSLPVPDQLQRDGLYTALVVTLPGPAQPAASVNLQAPIVIDTLTGIGRQVILPDSRFGVSHAFDLEALTHAA